MMFGSSFHKNIQPGFIIDNYLYCEGKQNKHFKTICRPNQVKSILSPHHVLIKNPTKYIDPYKRIISGPFNIQNTIDIIQINHYWGKSEEEHYEKRDRGRATTEEKRVINKNLHDDYNQLKDDLIVKKYLDNVKNIYTYLNINIEIYQLLNKELKLNSLEEYKEHLFNIGIYEKNFCYNIINKYPDFNHNTYKQNYKDLSNMSDIELEIHYLKYGINEKRIINKLLIN